MENTQTAMESPLLENPGVAAQKTHGRSAAIRKVILGAAFLALSGCSKSCASGDKPEAIEKADPPEAVEKKYSVKKGDFLIKIANALGVPWESLLLFNEKNLQEEAVENCGKLSEKYRKGKKRRGYFCNEKLSYDGKPIVHANSLIPGQILVIPSTQSTPEKIEKIVAQMAGKNIVVVIDDTGSMRDDRQRVADWYFKSILKSGKKIDRVLLYADGRVREYKAGNVEFLTQGNVETTRQALEMAASGSPDAIILVSDEPGDDWSSFKNLKLPPVIAHSLHPSADENLKKVAELSKGQFVAGLDAN